MPTAASYRRAPLIDPAYVPLSDASIHPEGQLLRMIQETLAQVDIGRMTSLDSVLATKLGGYAELPPMPDVEAAAALLPGEPGRYLEIMNAATMLASMGKDKEGMLRVLAAMRLFLDAMPALSEEALFWCGADALRLTVTLYRRTGQRFLLDLLEALRAQLPDVSGLMHMFPFQREYRPENGGSTQEEQLYYQRMERFATGKGTADALAMTALLAQYSGSGRDAAAAKVGATALQRFHGMPCGAFAADPYLAGRDPARAVELSALCAQIEACFDALCATGDLAFAERLDRLTANALPDLLTGAGVRGLEPTNRLADDDSCQARPAEPADTGALLRALYALRRGVWLSKDDGAIAYLSLLPGGCLTRMNGVPVRLTAETSGAVDRDAVIRVECKQGVRFTLLVRVPAWAEGAMISVNGGKAQAAPAGELFPVTREFNTGDTVALRFKAALRLETGYRGSVSVLCGATLLALPLPEEAMAWQYALIPGTAITAAQEGDQVTALVTACEAPLWKEKAGFILPPPQGTPVGAAYELTLIPYAGTGGRIAAFPCARA